MNKVEVYQEMKDSGVSWIGKVPIHWEIKPMKAILENCSEKNHPDEEVLSLYRDLGVVPKNSRDDNHNVTSEDTSQYKFVQAGNLVINKMKAWQGSLAVSDFTGIVSPAYYVCAFKDSTAHKKFFHYLLRSTAYAQEFEKLSTGMRIGQWDLGIKDFMRVTAVVPPSMEQQAIAGYLDEACSQIESVISEAKASIEDYKQWKASIIYEAVTKGLDPDVEMKDSGVEWVGKIPSSWKVKRGKNILTLIQRAIKNDDEIITCFRDGQVTLRRNRREDGFTVALKETGYQGIEPGDLVVHGMDGFAGAIGISDSRGKASPVLNVLDSSEYKPYIAHYLKALAYRDVFMSLSTGIRVRSCDLRWNKLANIPYIIPSKEEQVEIVNYISIKIKKIDSLIEEKQNFIADLEAYKKSLIYEVVTGKRRVI